MKYVLVLLASTTLNPSQTATSIGPFDDAFSCQTVQQLASRDGWKAKCYPIGKIEEKKATQDRLPTENENEKKKDK